MLERRTEPRGDSPPRAPTAARLSRRLNDSHGRAIRDLRISITDRCNFRCVYCMDPDVRFAPKDEMLRVEEIVRLARLCASLGVCKIRLTGGEPTLHKGLTKIIEGIRRETRVELAMITNGSLLSAPLVREWRAAGLDRITISLDSLLPERFARLTRSATTPEAVIAGIQTCIEEGFPAPKINTVLIRGLNDDEAADMAALALRQNLELRFIEYMPLDSGGAWSAAKMVPASETLAAISKRFDLVACTDDDPSSTARTFRFAGAAPNARSRIGLIAPVSSPFCGACSRLRLTADGKVRPCLFSAKEWDIRARLRAGATDNELIEFLIDATWTKDAGHAINSASFQQPARTMSAIGG